DDVRSCRFYQRRQRINEMPGEKMKELCLHLKAMVALQGILFPERPLSSLHLFQQLFRSMTEAYKKQTEFFFLRVPQILPPGRLIIQRLPFHIHTVMQVDISFAEG